MKIQKGTDNTARYAGEDVSENQLKADIYEFSLMNPMIKENFAFWKNFVVEKRLYALMLSLNETEKTPSFEYTPLSEKAYENLVKTGLKEGSAKKHFA